MILGELSEYTLNSNSIIVFGHVLLAPRLYDHLWYVNYIEWIWKINQWQTDDDGPFWQRTLAMVCETCSLWKHTPPKKWTCLQKRDPFQRKNWQFSNFCRGIFPQVFRGGVFWTNENLSRSWYDKHSIKTTVLLHTSQLSNASLKFVCQQYVGYHDTIRCIESSPYQ